MLNSGINSTTAGSFNRIQKTSSRSFNNTADEQKDFFSPGAGSEILDFDLQKAAKILSEKGKLNKIEDKWSFDIIGTVNDPPAKGPDGSLVFGCNGGPGGGTLYSVDPVTGQKNWEYPSGIILRAVAVSPDNTVFASTSDGKVISVDGKSGQEKWTLHLKSRHNSTPLVSDNGLVYVGTGDGNLLALNQSDGTEKWSVKDKKMVSAPPLEAPGNTLIFGGHDHKLCRVDKETGSPLWEKDLEWNISSTPVLSDDEKTLYASTSRGEIFAMNLEDGEIIWRSKTGNTFETDAQVIKGKGSDLFVRSNDDNIYKLRAGDGRMPRSFPGGGRLFGSPFVTSDGNGICYGNSNGQILCKDVSGGDTKWSHKLDREIFSVSEDPDTGLIYATGKKGITAIKLLSIKEQVDQLKEEIVNTGEPSKPTVEFEQGEGFVNIGGVKLDVES